jgi:hypothetical protein
MGDLWIARVMGIPKRKGPLASKRPKSREETPKEGGGKVMQITYRTAITYTAPHQNQEGKALSTSRFP